MSTRKLTPRATDRLRSGLRRHGLVPRPAPLPALVGGGLRFTAGNAIELYDWGGPALEAMLEAIVGARSRIHLETYILRADQTGRRFLTALAERAAAGVAVHVLYDAVGSLTLDPTDLAPLERAGAVVVAFNPLRRFWSTWLPRRRDHRKILTVDGVVAFTGGLNIGDEYERDWRDTHLRIRGPAVRELDAVFLESWFRADAPELDWRELLEHGSRSAGTDRCAVLPDGPVYQRRSMRELVVGGLENVERRACFTSPYFAPGRRVLDALETAARRGVVVELLVAGVPSDHPWLRRGAYSLYPRLLDAGVRVFEYQGAMMHAKVAVFDDAWAVVGTSNLDRQSLVHSYEVNVVAEGQTTAEALARSFTSDLAASREITADTLARRGPLERAFDALAGLALRLV